MIVVFLGLMMALGVLFGMQAMVVDLGYDMGQQGVMQNGADAGALAVAKLLASSVADTSPISYVASDDQVQAAASQFASYNRAASNPTATYQTAVAYLLWNSAAATCSAGNQPVFTASSDPGLVAEVGGVRNTLRPDVLGSVPSGTCGVRVFARVTHSAIFGQLMGQSTARATASAAARVYPTNPPTTFTNLWPITRWLGAGACTFTINSPPCTFWDSHGPPNGNFKLMVDMSRYSALVYPSPLRPQHITDYDHTYPGNSTNRQTDLNNWLTYSWHGQLYVGDPRCSVNSPSILQFSNCTNSRLETYNGTLGSNVGNAMRAFIDAHAEGVDTSGQNLGKYVTMHVFLWRYGESNINTSTDVASTLWTGGSSSSIQRVILDQVRCFRFYDQTVSNSNASGYYVSCLSTDPPLAGAPNAVANTVALMD
jgi:Flp pilus assembly protein TadG